MTEQLSFINNGKRYVTIFDASDFLKSFAEPNSNVCDASVIQMSGGASQAFKSLAGVPVRDVPIMVDADVDTSGPAWVVTGKAMKNGELTPVKITAMGITWEGSQSSTVEEIPVDTSLETVDDTQSIPEEVENSSTIEEDLPAVVESVVESVEEPEIDFTAMTEENNKSKGQEALETVMRAHDMVVRVEGAVIGEVKESDVKPILDAMKVNSEVTNSKFEDCMNPPVIEVPCQVAGLVLKPTQPTNAGLSYKKPVAPKHGITFGIPESDGIRELAPGLVLGAESRPNVNGLCFGKIPEPIKPTTTKEPEKEEVVEEHVKTEEEVNAELMERWKHSAPPDTLKKWDQPVTTPETPTEEVNEEVKEVVDTKALKESLRATYSEEVNDVIGQIPHQILGNISEFTTNVVDIKRLEVEGDIYCIDNRWHKCGKWYCIDVVQNKARYFYNSRLNVSIEIPLSICKEWLAVVS